MLNWLRCPPLSMLVFAALLLGMAPFYPEPHLVEKARMLTNGEHLRPIDIFDIFWHAWPLLWLVLRLFVPKSATCNVSIGHEGPGKPARQKNKESSI